MLRRLPLSATIYAMVEDSMIDESFILQFWDILEIFTAACSDYTIAPIANTLLCDHASIRLGIPIWQWLCSFFVMVSTNFGINNLM